MQFVNGMVVRSKKGHDKGRFFVVIRLEGGFAYLSDGINRSGKRLKKKNLIHLAPTKTVLLEDVMTDNEIKKTIAGFTGRLCSS